MYFITLIEQIDENEGKMDFGNIYPICFLKSPEDCLNALGPKFSNIAHKGYDYVCIEEIDPGVNPLVKSRCLYALDENVNAYFKTKDILPDDYCFAFNRKGAVQHV